MGSEQMLPLRLASKRSKTARIVASAGGAPPRAGEDAGCAGRPGAAR